jgi:hypothetical protein
MSGLMQLNAGFGVGYSQIGKIFTLYFSDESMIVPVAILLDKKTSKFRCPSVPFDERFRSSRNVYFRYGSIAAKDGQKIMSPNGDEVEDIRTRGSAIPEWLVGSSIHFELTKNQKQSAPSQLLPPDLLLYEAISQRGKGGVYKALNLSSFPACISIVKEGRKDGELNAFGLDGYTLAKREARHLSLLGKKVDFLPKIIRIFDYKTHFYVSMTQAKGVDIAVYFSVRRRMTVRLRFAKKLMNTVASLNSIGWHWRDCKPTNVFFDGNDVTLIDFEGACIKGQCDTSRWGTQGYIPDLQIFDTVRQDQYSALITAIQVICGSFERPELVALISKLESKNVITGIKKSLLRFLRKPCPSSLSEGSVELLSYVG